MIEQDTIRLLRECDAGVRMGVDSIDDVLGHVKHERMQQILQRSRDSHERLGREIQQHLQRFEDSGKAPNPIAKTMSRMKTAMSMMMHDDDATVASLMIDGCNMGVKSLSMYLNQYGAADELSKDIVKGLIRLEEQLAVDLREFL